MKWNALFALILILYNRSSGRVFSSPLSQYLSLCYSSSPGTSELSPVPPVEQLPLSKITWREIRSVTYAVETSWEQSSFSIIPHLWNPLSEYTAFIFKILILFVFSLFLHIRPDVTRRLQSARVSCSVCLLLSRKLVCFDFLWYTSHLCSWVSREPSLSHLCLWAADSGSVNEIERLARTAVLLSARILIIVGFFAAAVTTWSAGGF